MNTPDPVLLRKAIKITTEIEHIDQELHRLLATVCVEGSSVKEQVPAVSSEKESKELPPEAVVSEVSSSQIITEASSNIPETPQADISESVLPEVTEENNASDFEKNPQHPQEQQALLMEDSGQEPLALITTEAELAPNVDAGSETREDHSFSF